MGKAARRRAKKKAANVWVDPTQDSLHENANTEVGKAVLQIEEQADEFDDNDIASLAYRDPKTGDWIAW